MVSKHKSVPLVFTQPIASGEGTPKWGNLKYLKGVNVPFGRLDAHAI